MRKELWLGTEQQHRTKIRNKSTDYGTVNMLICWHKKGEHGN